MDTTIKVTRRSKGLMAQLALSFRIGNDHFKFTLQEAREFLDRFTDDFLEFKRLSHTTTLDIAMLVDFNGKEVRLRLDDAHKTLTLFQKDVINFERLMLSRKDQYFHHRLLRGH